MYNDFKNKWLGSRIDYDHVYGFQCVDLILEYIYECYGIGSGVWGNAIDYWYSTSLPLLNKFDRVAGADAEQGDIVVLNGLAGNPYGHIGICESADGSNITILEQNGNGGGDGLGGNAVRTRAVSKTRVAGLLRPKSAAAPTQPSAPGTVYLPADVRSWRLYRLGSGLRPNTSDQIAVLAPSQYGGLTYNIVSRVGDYAVVIDTKMFGRGTIWIKDTPAVLK